MLLHQSVIGLEAKAACDKYGIKPDIIIGCAGGGSNLGGLISPFMGEKIRGEADYRFIAVEPASCPSFTRGKFEMCIRDREYSSGPCAGKRGLSPSLTITTDGKEFLPHKKG